MRQPPILMYHWFRGSGVPSASRSPQLEITPERFAEQIEELIARGYRPTTLGRTLAAEPGTTPRPIAITFDDGTADFFEHARPVLLRHDARATLFVVTDRVGESSDWDADVGEPARPLMTWDQLRTLDEEGFEIESHTARHTMLTRLTADEIARDLEASRATLTRELGHPPRFLAYPRGAWSVEHLSQVRASGFDAACAVILGWSDLATTDRYALKRMTVKGDEGLGRFRLRVRMAGWVRGECEALPDRREHG